MNLISNIKKIKIPPALKEISNYTPGNAYNLALTIVVGIIIAIVAIITIMIVPQRIKNWWRKIKERP